MLTPVSALDQIACSAMAEDTNGWSEKGKGSQRGQRPAKGETSDDASTRSSSTPSRPSKRDTSSTSGSGDSSVVRTPSGDAGARKVAHAAATAGQRDVSFAQRLGFPALIALICLLGIGVVVYARSTRDALASPVQNLDHWHAVYGVYNCNLTGEGDDKYLPPFQSTQSDTGIHSHGDGIMHIHPFFELASGSNAQMRHWLTEMNVEITPEQIVVSNQFDPPAQMTAGQECADGTGTAEIKLLHWDFDFQALADDRPEPEVITEDFGLVKFDHDREVYVFAYVSEDTDLADIPIPPQVRFNTLNNVSNAIEYEPETLIPQDTGVGVTATNEDGEEIDVTVNPGEDGTDAGETETDE